MPCPRLPRAPWPTLAVLVAGWWLAGCSTVPTPAANPAPFVPDRLTPEARVAAFDQVANTIAQRYVDAKFNGVDWAAVQQRYRPLALAAPDDEAYWQLLDRMVGELKDAHTTVRSPLQVRATRAQRGQHGVQLMRLGEDWVVAGLAGNSQAALLGLRPGQRLLKVNGEPVAPWWQKQLAQVRGSSTERSQALLVNRRLNEAAVDSELTLDLVRADGSPQTLRLRQDPLQHPLVRSHHLANGLGYLRFAAFNPAIRGEIDNALKRLATTRGLVLDLRGNPGGNLKMTTELLGWWLADGEVGEVITRDNQRLTALAGLLDTTPSLKVKAQAQRLAQPLAVLVDENSASASELLTAVLQDQGRARVFGSVTCGCLLATRAGDALPGGGRLQFSEVDMRIGRGKRVEGQGVVPDVPVTPNPAAALAGDDVVLNAAWAWLENQAVAPNPATTAPTASSTAQPEPAHLAQTSTRPTPP